MTEHLGLAIALVAAGSAVGGMARFFVSGAVARAVGEIFPWGTMVVNVTGAFSVGFLAMLARSHAPFADPELWLLAVTGFLGSYTTVSSFSLQTLAFLRAGDRRRAVVNVVLSLGLCLSAVAAGMQVASTVMAVVPR